jgi:hypothetical protein
MKLPPLTHTSALLSLALVLCTSALLSPFDAAADERDRNKQKLPPPGAVYEQDLPPEDLPDYLERVVDFMWLEEGSVWKDRYTVRVYPRLPRVETFTRFNMRIRRTRDDVGRADPSPKKVEITLRRTDGKGHMKQEMVSPGSSVSFDYQFERPGEYIVSIVTYSTDTETYTVTMRFNVLPKAAAQQAPPK